MSFYKRLRHRQGGEQVICPSPMRRCGAYPASSQTVAAGSSRGMTPAWDEFRKGLILGQTDQVSNLRVGGYEKLLCLVEEFLAAPVFLLYFMTAALNRHANHALKETDLCSQDSEGTVSSESSTSSPTARGPSPSILPTHERSIP